MDTKIAHPFCLLLLVDSLRAMIDRSEDKEFWDYTWTSS